MFDGNDNQNHNQDVDAFLASNSSCPMVRVKQESDVEEDDWRAFVCNEIRPMSVVSSNEPHLPTSSNSSSEVESITSNTRECVFSNDVEVSKDDVAKHALQVLLGMNVDMLSSDELQAKVKKVQQCFLHHSDGAESPADGKCPTTNVAIVSNAEQVIGDTETKSRPNPMIGATVYIFSGTYAGLSGRLISVNRSWYLIDNPTLVQARGSRMTVQCFNCKLVCDIDLEAEVKAFCTNERRWLPPIISPEQLDRLAEEADSKPGDKRTAGGNNNHIEKTNKKQRKVRSREADNLKDFLRPGGHWLAPAQQRAPVKTADDDLGLNQNLRSMATSNGPVVKSRCWDDQHANTKDFHGELKPTHYSSLPEYVSSIANLVKEELLRRFRPGWDGANDIVSGACEVHSGYFRGHMHNDVSVQLRACLPANIQVKQNAGQIGIVFYNSKDGQCDCHFDRDSSALVLISGYKEVKLAPPMRELDRPADGILDGVDPFSWDERLHGGFKWETVHMGPGSVLIIPKYWLHCIKSTPDTLALSFQIILTEGCNPPSERIWVPHDATIQSPVQAHAIGNAEATSSATAYAQTVADKGNVATASKKSGHTKPPAVSQKPKARVKMPKAELYPKTANARSRVKSETGSYNSRGMVKSEGMSLSKRSSSRHVPRCAICLQGFEGREMWVLRYQGMVTPRYLPEYPLSLRKHLICKDCCPGTGTGMVYPWTKISYPDGSNRCILSKAEFCEDENLDEIDYKKYAYVTASSVDYTARIINKGRSV